jgi:hypothetical protein
MGLLSCCLLQGVYWPIFILYDIDRARELCSKAYVGYQNGIPVITKTYPCDYQKQIHPCEYQSGSLRLQKQIPAATTKTDPCEYQSGSL